MHQSGSFFPIALQVWFRFYQQTCLHVAAGKQCSLLFLLSSRHNSRPHSWRQSWRWWLTHSQLRSPELPLLIHTRQTLGWLGSTNLHSQREAFSSQPSGNLDMCLMFPQETTGWARSGSETSLDAGHVFPLRCSKKTLEIQRPWESYNNIL